MEDTLWIPGLSSHATMDILHLKLFQGYVEFQETGMEKHQHAV